MTNINLLPPEIAEKRKTEARRGLMAAAGVAAAGLVVAVYLVVRVQVSGAEREVEQLQRKSARLASAKTQLQQFADRKAELQKRQKIAAEVVEKRVDWAKLLNEISMVTPSDVWLSSIKGTESEGLTFQAWALEQTATAEATTTGASTTSKETTGSIAPEGHKPVAKWMVRLSLVKELTDIWLTSSADALFELQPAIQFETTAAWRTPHVPASASAPTAPPAANPPASGTQGGG